MKMSSTQKLVSAFNQQKCWMIKPLSEQINYSIPSVRRFLSEMGYYSSFTHNGRWYTLASIPRFGNDGLWFHKDIGFSKKGTLTCTIVSLIESSPSGMTADQIGTLLQCRCHAVLVQLWRKGRIERQKSGRSYVYISIDQSTAIGQIKAIRQRSLVPLSAELAVWVLVEFIKTPGAEPRHLAKAVSRRTGTKISTAQIQRLFEEYGLKKTA